MTSPQRFVTFSTAAMRMLATALLIAPATATAQSSYPTKPIRFITPYPPGGGTSVVARIIGQKLTESWGQQVLVDNRGGGNTIIGTEIGAKSSPDGYTMLFVDSTLAILPNLYPTLPYNALRDFAPVASLTRIPFMLVLHPSLQANNLQDLIAFAKSKPGQLNYASSGSGGQGHLAMEVFSQLTGVRMQHVPYKGGGPALTDLLGGQVQLHLNVPINLISPVKSGRLRAVAISGESRLAALPQVPTFTEAGLPNFKVSYWQGVAMPSGAPKPIVARMSNEIARILAMSDVRERLVTQGAEPFISNSAQFAAMIRTETLNYARVIKTANIKLDQ
jgi:tripartite-type tricarboxylate transporter receptor subunit TctC